MSESTVRQLRSAIADAYTFVRSEELNRAISTVTIEQLMADHVARLTGSETSRSNPFNPYAFDPEKVSPATSEPIRQVNSLSGSDTGLPSKRDRVLALQTQLGAVIDQVKALGELAFESTQGEDEPEGLFVDGGVAA